MKKKLKQITFENKNKLKWLGVILGIIGGLSLAGGLLYKKTCKEIMNIRIDNFDSNSDEKNK